VLGPAFIRAYVKLTVLYCYTGSKASTKQIKEDKSGHALFVLVFPCNISCRPYVFFFFLGCHSKILFLELHTILKLTLKMLKTVL